MPYLRVNDRYGEPKVIHLNSYLGKLYIYHIQGEKVYLYAQSITVPCESIEFLVQRN